MKKHFNLLKSLLVLAVISLVCSCKDENKNYLKVVPDDAFVTMSFNCASLSQKGDLANDLMLKGASSMLLLQLEPEAQTFALELLENPGKSGIDFRKPAAVSIFGENLAGGDAEVAFVFSVEDKVALQTAIETLGKKADLVFKNEGNVTVVSDPAPGVSIAFDGTSLLLLASKNRKAMDLMQLPMDKQAVVCDPNFQSAVAGGADIAFYMNYEKLFSVLPQDQLEKNGLSAEMLEMYKDMRISTTTNFENGKIVTEMKTLGADKVQEFSKQFQLEATGKNFDYLPESSIAVLQFGVRNLVDMLKLYPAEMQQKIESFFAEDGGKLSDLNDIEGDITVAFVDIVGKQPQYLVAIDCNADSLKNKKERYDQMTQKYIESGMFKKVSENVLVATIPNSPVQVYMVAADNKMLVLDESLYKQIVKGDKLVALAKNYNSNPLSSIIKKGGFALDFKPLYYMLNSVLAGNPNQGVVLNAVGKFENMVVAGELNSTTGTCTIQMTDKEKNSLRQLIELGESLATGR